jgi:hypothetical protein
MKRKPETRFLLIIFGFPLLLLLFIIGLYVGNCGFNQNCTIVRAAPIYHTPIPTLVAATLPAPQLGEQGGGAGCAANANTLLGAWVSAGFKEDEPFQFTDAKGTACQATFEDLQPLFHEANLWYNGAQACISCHHADLTTAMAQLDLSSYQGILAGAFRTSPDAQGQDILGGGNWEQSKLHEVLFVTKIMPLGRPPGAVPENGPTIPAGEPLEGEQPQETPGLQETPGAGS